MHKMKSSTLVKFSVVVVSLVLANLNSASSSSSSADSDLKANSNSNSNLTTDSNTQGNSKSSSPRSNLSIERVRDYVIDILQNNIDNSSYLTTPEPIPMTVSISRSLETGEEPEGEQKAAEESQVENVVEDPDIVFRLRDKRRADHGDYISYVHNVKAIAVIGRRVWSGRDADEYEEERELVSGPGGIAMGLGLGRRRKRRETPTSTHAHGHTYAHAHANAHAHPQTQTQKQHEQQQQSQQERPQDSATASSESNIDFSHLHQGFGYMTKTMRYFASLNRNFEAALQFLDSAGLRGLRFGRSRGKRAILNPFSSPLHSLHSVNAVSVIPRIGQAFVVNPNGVTCRDLCYLPNDLGLIPPTHALLGICTADYCECDVAKLEYKQLLCPTGFVFDPLRVQCTLPHTSILCSDDPPAPRGKLIRVFPALKGKHIQELNQAKFKSGKKAFYQILMGGAGVAAGLQAANTVGGLVGGTGLASAFTG